MIFDRLITALFVAILGAVWFLTRFSEISTTHKIIAYDILGRRIHLEGLRTTFDTRAAATSFAKHYGKRFPQYQFCLESSMPQVKRRFLMLAHK